MAEAVVSIALETLRDLLLEECKFLLGVSSEVKGLQTQLKEIRCLLEDADGRQHESKSVANWIAEIRDLAHRSEDAIETYAYYFSSKRGRGLKRLLRRFSCVLNDSFSLHQIGSEISKIKTEIARVTKSMQEYGIRSIIHGESSTANPPTVNQEWKRQTFPFEVEDCFVGKEEELRQLVSLIVDDKQHRVISIWGMGGIGKTTIARKVYNHIDTKRSFDSFAWVCITQQCQIKQVLEDVLKQLNPQKRNDFYNLCNTELIIQLCQIQKSKRCIVVLDDLWEVDHWDGLKHAFLVEGLESKILLTTRKRNVAKMGFAFMLGLLNIEDGWQLLKKKAFPHSNISDFSVEEKLLQKLGEEMVRKCGYLPLVISLLGGVLSKRKSMAEWELVNNNINAYLYRGEGIEKGNETHGVLNLSYEDLPYYLKPCFLYMGQFKEDRTINVYTLYRMWIAQGMISHENQGKETLMDIAELYLSELASRCIVQVEDYISEENYRSCKLHDVVRELCLSKGKEEDFCFQVMEYQGRKFSTMLHESFLDIRVRHLAIHFHRELEPECGDYAISHEDTSKHVRSLQFFNDIRAKKIEFSGSIIDFQKFKLLRVLVFQRFKFAGRKLPRGIGNLIHLRYLVLRKCELDELPSSIDNLAYLNTLDLLYSRNVRVPNVLKKMFRLRHLLLPSYDTKKIGNYRLRLDGLEELETLSGFNSLVHDLKSVTKIKSLRSLGAALHDNESVSTIINAIMTNWKNLHYCNIAIRKGCRFTSTNEGTMILKRVFKCPNLHVLSINVPVGKLLVECETEIIISRLVGLCLAECEIEDDPMEILGKLPCLEYLRLSKKSFLGEEMKCHAFSFPRLKNLLLACLPNLRKWRVEQGAMPLLSSMHIYHCLHLKKVPDGLRFIASLQKLTIEGMPELAKRVLASSDDQRGGEDFNKVCHVPSIIILGDGDDEYN